MAAHGLNDNLRAEVAKHLDEKYGGETGIYSNTAAALSGVRDFERVEGLTVLVRDGATGRKEYWFDQNGNLQEKNPAADLNYWQLSNADLYYQESVGVGYATGATLPARMSVNGDAFIKDQLYLKDVNNHIQRATDAIEVKVNSSLHSKFLDTGDFSVLGGSLIASDLAGAASGLAVDASGKLVNMTLGEGLLFSGNQLSLDASILNQLEPKGAWNAATNSPSIPAAAAANNGHFYIVSGTVSAGHGYANVPNEELKGGDWLLSNGTSWEKVKNSAATNWIQNGNDAYFNGGNISVGVSSSNGHKFRVLGSTSLDGTAYLTSNVFLSQDLYLPPQKKLILDSGSGNHTYIWEGANGIIRFVSGGAQSLELKSAEANFPGLINAVNNSASPNYIKVANTGSTGWLGAYFLAESDTNGRGAGIAMAHGSAGHWYAGTPYQNGTLNYMIGYLSGAWNQTTADISNALFTLSTAGQGSFDGGVVTNTFTSTVSSGWLLKSSLGNHGIHYNGSINIQSLGTNSIIANGTNVTLRNTIINNTLRVNGETKIVSTNTGLSIEDTANTDGWIGMRTTSTGTPLIAVNSAHGMRISTYGTTTPFSGYLYDIFNINGVGSAIDIGRSSTTTVGINLMSSTRNQIKTNNANASLEFWRLAVEMARFEAGSGKFTLQTQLGIGKVATLAIDVEGADNANSQARFEKTGTGNIIGIGADRDTTNQPWIGTLSNDHLDFIVNSSFQVVRISNNSEVILRGTDAQGFNIRGYGTALIDGLEWGATTYSDFNATGVSAARRVKHIDGAFQATNRPSTNYSYGFEQVSHNTSFRTQMVFDTDGKIFTRNWGGSSWTSWRELLTSTSNPDLQAVTNQGNTTTLGLTIGGNTTIGGGGIANTRLVTRGASNDSTLHALEAAQLSGTSLLTVRNDGLTTLFRPTSGTALALDVANGQQYTQMNFHNNGTQKASIWWDNVNTRAVLWTGTDAIRATNSGDVTLPNGYIDVQAGQSTVNYKMAAWDLISWTGNTVYFGGISSGQWNRIEFETNNSTRFTITDSVASLATTLDVVQDIRHIGDSDTLIRLTTDQVALWAGNYQNVEVQTHNVYLKAAGSTKIQVGSSAITMSASTTVNALTYFNNSSYWNSNNVITYNASAFFMYAGASKSLYLGAGGINDHVTVSTGGTLTVNGGWTDLYRNNVSNIARVRSTNVSGGYVGWYDGHNSNNAYRGYVGYGSTLFSGGALNDFGIRSDVSLLLASGGNTVAVEVDTNQKTHFYGAIGFKTNVWNTSDDSYERLYFGNGTHTYIKSPNDVIFRSENSNVDYAYVNGGRFSTEFHGGTSWGANQSGNFFASLDDNANATWLISANQKHSGNSNYGIQVLNQGVQMRIYAGTDYLGITSAGITFNGSAITGSYTYWQLQANGGATDLISHGEIVNFVNGTGISITKSGNNITINTSSVNADTVDGYHASTSYGANTAVVRDVSGYIYTSWHHLQNGTGLYMSNGAYFFQEGNGWNVRSASSTISQIRLQNNGGGSTFGYLYGTSTAIGLLDNSAQWVFEGHATGGRIHSNTSTYVQLELYTNDDSRRGAVYANTSNQVGFLDSDGQWAYRISRDSSHEFLSNNVVRMTLAGSGDLTISRVNTGIGFTEVYLMNQNVRTTDSPTFADLTVSRINTGIGFTEVYNMNQNVRTTDSPTFVDLTVSRITTGLGFTEVYLMNQNVRTTDSPTFNTLFISSYVYHTGDTNTYMGFNAADQWRVVAGGTQRLLVTTSGINVTGTGVYSSSVTATNFIDTSDSRYKREIGKVKGIDLVRVLNPVFYDKKGIHESGFYADKLPIEAQYMRHKLTDGGWGMDYKNLHAVQIAAIKHIDSEVTTLKKKVRALESEIEQLKAA